MTFIPRHQEKHCFVACSEDKVNSGLCDCINRMRNEALHQPLVSGSLPLFKCKCGYETSNSVAWCTHADCCNGNDR